VIQKPKGPSSGTQLISGTKSTGFRLRNWNPTMSYCYTTTLKKLGFSVSPIVG